MAEARDTSFARALPGGGWRSNAATGSSRVWGMGFTVRNRKTFRRQNNPETEQAKVLIREHVFDEVAKAGRGVHVLDAYAGEGHLYRRVWHKADSYVGCDETFYRDERSLYCCDNKRLLRAINLNRFTVVDLDAFGEPWSCMTILSARRRLVAEEVLGVVITDGSGMPARLSKHPAALLRAAGLSDLAKTPSLGGHRQMVKTALGRLAAKMGGRLTRQWEAEGTTGSRCLYIGVTIRGTSS